MIAARERLQTLLLDPRPWVRALVVLGAGLAVALPVGAAIGLLGGLVGSALLLALVAGYVMLRSLHIGLIAVIVLVFLLPFAALPFDIGFSPTFLDLALVGVFFVWLSRIAAHRQEPFVAPAPALGVLTFALLAVVAFIAGLSHAAITANVLRHLAEIILGVLFFFLVVNAVRGERELRWMVFAILAACTLAALIGIALYVMPQSLAIRLLSALRVVRYPSGAGVLRYIEDDPALPLRAISTSIDPNVLGGALIFGTTIAVAQLLAHRPIVPRIWLALATGAMGLCLILTFSRGSFVGLIAALGAMGLVRHRKLLWIGLLALALMLLLPPAQAYVQHFIEGLHGQDLATQMRFGEYKDAFILIGRHPWLGVGFAGTPEIDTYIGVSSVYLLIAEEMGLPGLAVFLLTLLAVMGAFFGTLRTVPRASSLEPLLAGPGFAILGAMVGGIADHYLFNLVFPHATVLLWLMVGLTTVGVQTARRAADATAAGA